MMNVFIFFVGFSLVSLWSHGAVVVLGKPSNTYDLCGESYLRFSNVGDSGVITFDKTSTAPDPPNPCVLRVGTCSSCKLAIMLNGTSNLNFRCDSGVTSIRYCSLSCDYLYIFDTYYMNQTLKYYQSSWLDPTFTSESSNVFIGLCHGYSTEYSISLSFKVVPKLNSIDGSPTYRHQGPLMSPFFPNKYSQNHETYQYLLTNQLASGYVKLMFDDWHLESSSGFYFEDSNIVGFVGGDSVRPVVISNKNSLLVKFQTGQSLSPTQPGTFMGFKATYTFISNKDYEYTPRTSCKDAGYLFNSYGGVIDFKPDDRSRQRYDCLWVLPKQTGFTGVFLRIIKFINPGNHMRGENQLIIKSGLDSTGFTVTEIDQMDNIENGVPYKDTQGFYVHLNGTFTFSDQLKFVYASYKSMFECTGDLFQCGGGICIHTSLRCDGYAHCGDGSDESRCGDATNSQWDKSYQYTITIGVIIPMVISVFLIMVICLLFVMIRRCRRARMQNAGSVERLRTLSEDVNRTRGRRRRRHRRGMFGERDQPPTYDEAMQNPPGWYLNVAFSNPVDPTLPQPPSYSEAVGQDVPAHTRPRSHSRSSLESSQSELTVCSHNQSESSSSSDEEDTWGNFDEASDGRRARRSRHVSSSNSENEAESNQATPDSLQTGQMSTARRAENQQQQPRSSAGRSDNERETKGSLGERKIELTDGQDKDKHDPKMDDGPREFVIPETNKVDVGPKDHYSYASRIVQSVLGTRRSSDSEPRANHSHQRSISSGSEAATEENKRNKKKKTKKPRREKPDERYPNKCLEDSAALSKSEQVPFETHGASNYDHDLHSDLKPENIQPQAGLDSTDMKRPYDTEAETEQEVSKQERDGYEMVVNVDNDSVMLVYDTHYCDIPQNQARSVPEHINSANSIPTSASAGCHGDNEHNTPSQANVNAENESNKATVKDRISSDLKEDSGSNKAGAITNDNPVSVASQGASQVSVQHIVFDCELSEDIYV